MAARAKQESVAAYDRGDMALTRARVAEADRLMQAVPCSASSLREIEEIAQLAADLEQGEGAKFRKRSSWQAFIKHRGQGS